jgi:hypothetical protein
VALYQAELHPGLRNVTVIVVAANDAPLLRPASAYTI